MIKPVLNDINYLERTVYEHKQDCKVLKFLLKSLFLTSPMWLYCQSLVIKQ